MAGTSAMAKMLLLRTVAQFNAVRSHEDVSSTMSSFRAIDRWFAPGDGSAGHAFEGYQPSYKVLMDLVKHGASQGSSLRNVLALRMWVAQHNAKLPPALRDDDWGVPSWYDGGMHYDSVDMDEGVLKLHRQQAAESRVQRLVSARKEAETSAQQQLAVYTNSGGVTLVDNASVMNVLTLTGQQRCNTTRVAGLGKNENIPKMLAELQFRKDKLVGLPEKPDELGCRALAKLMRDFCSFPSDNSENADLLVRWTHLDAADAAAAAAAAAGQ